MPSDLLNARAATPAPPPALHPHLRENLVRGLRATIDRDEHRLEMLRARGKPCATLQLRIDASRADLAELEAL
jgi:hypothetical protein